MDGKSLEILSDKITKLKDIIPEAFTEEKIDWEKLKAALGEDINFENERYNLNWAGKSDAFRVLQQRTSGTLRPVKDESVNFDKTENVFIEGENLEVLKILQKSYFGKIKMIYIDPPYNTGSDSFIYPDKFSETKDEYLKRIGDKDEEGFLLKEGFYRKNSKESGHYHSNWLSMMYPRLYTARNLLREDGVIFVSIDDNEVHNLRMIMDEIFGAENFVGTFIWKRRSSSALAEKNVSTDHEYIVCFQKMDSNSFLGNEKDYSGYSNPDNDPRGEWVTGDLTVGMTKDQRPNQFYVLVNPKTGKTYNPNPNRVWAFIPVSMNKLLAENRVIFPDDKNKRPMVKRFKDELKSTTNPFSTWLAEVGMNSEATREIREILEANIFSYSKPLSLVKKIIKQTLRTNEIVLDFFAGSGTTAQAVMELNKEDGGNRKFILVQLPEKTDESSEAYKAKYFTIADICKERIRRVIE
ncbi:MAG: site-specific DNA-methyltransferase, partial [Ignavibacteriaceae bacterium]